MEEKLLEIQGKIEAVEMHLTREHMKRVLGEVYLHTWITENTSVPTRGLCDFLMSDEEYDDRTARVGVAWQNAEPARPAVCGTTLNF